MMLFRSLSLILISILGGYMAITNNEPFLWSMPLLLIPTLIYINLKEKGVLDLKLTPKFYLFVIVIPMFIILIGAGIRAIILDVDHLELTLIHKIGELMILIPFGLSFLEELGKRIKSIIAFRYLTLLGGFMNLAVLIIDFDADAMDFMTFWLSFLFLSSVVIFFRYYEIYDKFYKSIHSKSLEQ